MSQCTWQNHPGALIRFAQRSVLLPMAPVVVLMQISIAQPAIAQEDPSSAPVLEEIVVSGSRVISDSLAAPTPITAVGADELRNSAPGSLVTALQQLPTLNIVGPATANQGGSNGTSGSSFLNLRSVGAQRTLVLLDGRRIVPQSQLGSPDVSMLPLQLVKRVDVVTGGASAAYGSDAVTGVVNFVLDTEFDGLKTEFQGGASDKGDKENYRGSITGGTGLGGGRAHVVASVEYGEDDGIVWNDRDFATEAWAVITNPNSTPANRSPSNPARLLVPGVTLASGSLGGLITSGPLAGTHFDPGGVPRPYNFGTLRSGSTMQGGEGPNGNDGSNLFAPQKEFRVFTHATYDFTDNLTGFIEASYGRNELDFPTFANWQTGNQQFTIFRDNAFLPASIRDEMTALNLSSFTMGRLSPDMGPMQQHIWNTLTRYVVGAKANLGDGWSFEAHYGRGETEHHTRTPYNTIQRNLYRAVDAVIDPATNQPVCRTRLQNPTSTNPEIANCVAMNVFGLGAPLQQSLDYVLGTSLADNLVKQDSAAAVVRGEPFASWAGPVGIAFGGEYRKESVNMTSDPISASIVRVTDIPGMPAALNGKVGGYNLTNIQPISGDYSVVEGFLETLVPLADDLAWAESLDLNAAVRYADYNLSGGVTTWKAGLVYQPIEGLRLRATRSRDIRAGNLNELFAAGSSTQPTVSDPFRNNVVASTIASTSGNPDLLPEEADTTTFGLTYRPSWLTGFGVSVDWYDIDIEGAITALPIQAIVDQCFEGNQNLCDLITRDANGVIAFIEGRTLNAALLETSGVDVEMTYLREVGSGSLGMRLLSTYSEELVTTVLGSAPRDNGGELGFPSWKGTLAVSYDRGPFSLYLQERYIGESKINNTFGPNDLDDNDIPSVFYTDLTARFRPGANANLEIFAGVNNLFDERPPHEVGHFFVIATRVTGNQTPYDVVGRAFTLGLTFRL